MPNGAMGFGATILERSRRQPAAEKSADVALLPVADIRPQFTLPAIIAYSNNNKGMLRGAVPAARSWLGGWSA
jgi:hypothetical protein